MNRIGLDNEKSSELADLLNDLLANYSVFYQNTRGYHWNIQGEEFFTLHEKFEELYNDLFLKIDEIAERILTLGFKANYKFSDYMNSSEIKESTSTGDGKHSVAEILEAFKVLIQKQRHILSVSGEIEDEGTNSLMSDYITEQEKTVWMYASYLK